MSDHFSGPRALAGPHGDITDVYAFPSPERPGHLALVMNVLPLAKPGARFSDAIVCRFRLRPVAIEGSGADASFPFGPEDEELVASFGFAAPPPNGADAAPVQEGWCTGPSGETAQFVVDDERGTPSDGLRVYAGLRADPFFIDLQAYFETMKAGRLAFKEVGTNGLAGTNVLTVVAEVDCRPLLQDGRGPLFGVVGETVVAGKLPVRIERFGRPEIKNHMLKMKEHDKVNRDLEVRDLYNLEDAFHMSGDYRGVYRARLNANLPVHDRLDGSIDWELGRHGEHPLTDLLLADYLVVDATKPYATDSFFEIERATLDGRAHETCGGRSLNENVMDTVYTLLIAGTSGRRVSDGVDQATTPASDVFPYLVPPNPNPPDVAPAS
jgi:Domain of unknown function (DUF4331)